MVKFKRFKLLLISLHYSNLNSYLMRIYYELLYREIFIETQQVKSAFVKRVWKYLVLYSF